MNDESETHSVLMGYLLWIFGFIGAHRFYYGKQITGVIWFFTYLFIELAPEDIVEEHRRSISNTYYAKWKDDDETTISEDDVQDAEFQEKF